MKNYIPLILAVVLGLAAVMAVSRILRQRHQEAEQTVRLVVAAQDLYPGKELTEKMLIEKSVPVSMRPRQAVYWVDRQQVFGLRPMRTIPGGDYVLKSDFAAISRLGDLLAPQEWAVTIDVSGGVADRVQPGDEVAVIGTLSVREPRKSHDASVPAEMVERSATLVLFPRVRILDTGGAGGTQREGARRLVVGLPPPEAQVLIAAQQRMELTLALRRPGDTTSLRREDAGMVDETTFSKLFKDLKAVEVPSIPGAAAAAAAAP